MKLHIATVMVAIGCVLSMTCPGITCPRHSDNAWKMLDSGVDASLRGLSVVDSEVVWCSGAGNTVIRTTDGGRHWKNVSVKGAENLDFRDIHAFDSSQALIVSAGQPARIYRTADGGESWQMCFQHPDPRSFFDAISFADQRYGMAMSDPIDSHVLLIETEDGGRHWTELPLDRRPPTLAGEAGFAASGSGMQIIGDDVFIALGGAEKGQTETSSRIVYSSDRGTTWQVATVPMARNESSGIFSLAFIDQQHGIAVGGDYLKPNAKPGNVALTNDGGRTWELPQGDPPGGYRSSVAHFRNGTPTTVVCVGPTGTDVSLDGGQSWQTVSEKGFHAIAFSANGKSGWACGSDGRVAKWIWKAADRQLERTEHPGI